MVQVRVAGVALDASQQHVVLLKPIDQLPGTGVVLPIWIGQLEATSILIAVQGADVPRPLAHDLMRGLLDAVGARVAGVEVTRLEGGTFYAEISLVTAAGARVVDARPSDAVALASRVGAPISVADAVIDEAGIPDTVTDDSETFADDPDTVTDDSDTDDSDTVERIDEFKRFLDDVEPEDFEG